MFEIKSVVQNKRKIGSGLIEIKSSPSTSSSNFSVSPNFSSSLIDDFISYSSTDTKNINDIYREIYFYDNVSGSAVDLYSNLPWSDFHIEEKDPKIKKIFEDCLYEIDIINVMRSFSVIYQVLGCIIGSLLFDETRGIFTDIIIHNIDDCEITPIPVFGYDPKIDLKINPDLKKFLKSNDPRDKEALKEIPNKLFKDLVSKNKIPLEPLNTIYVVRNKIPGLARGMSYYTRILPIWLIEKALIRGTIIGAWRRQRSILHVTVGSEDWEPSDEQLEAIAQLFIEADKDPQGAVAVTRQGIETNEIRNGNDFWRISDEWDVFTAAKLRALGINESFLSGETSYNTMEVVLSVFMENLKTFREHLTRSVIYDKIFLLLSKYHDIKNVTQAELSHRIRINKPLDYKLSARQVRLLGKKDLSNFKDFKIPQIKWSKDLTFKYDSSYLDILSSVEEKGLPIPLSLYASSVGLSLESIKDSLKSEMETRKEIYNLKKEIDKIKPKQEEGGGMFGSYMPAEKVLTPKEALKVLNQIRGILKLEKKAKKRSEKEKKK